MGSTLDEESQEFSTKVSTRDGETQFTLSRLITLPHKTTRYNDEDLLQFHTTNKRNTVDMQTKEDTTTEVTQGRSF